VSDPRPGFEEVSPRHGWLAGWGWALVVGLAMGLLIFLGPADDRAHLLGGTTRTDTTVVDVRLESGCDSGQRAVYRLGWLDDAGVGHLSTFRRCGPVRHEVGDHVQMWVSPDRDKAWEEGPRELWVWALVGVPALGMLAAVLSVWRRRFLLRQSVRAQERRERRQARSTGG
jgi:heme exporter protein D